MAYRLLVTKPLCEAMLAYFTGQYMRQTRICKWWYQVHIMIYLQKFYLILDSFSCHEPEPRNILLSIYPDKTCLHWFLLSLLLLLLSFAWFRQQQIYVVRGGGGGICFIVKKSLFYFDQKNKNIERHTAHTFASWPTCNPKQWLMIHTSGLMMIIR